MTADDERTRDRVIKACVELAEQIWREGLDPPDGPKVLYHYTGPKGLLGIVQESQIRVSRATCLNDLREVKYGTSLAEEVTAERFRELNRNAAPSLAKALHHQLLSHPVLTSGKPGWVANTRSDAFVASFSAEPDSIGMWAYFARAGGYCLGLDRASLTKTLPPDSDDLRFSLSEVMYDRDEQRARFIEVIGRFEDMVQDQLASVPMLHQELGTLVAAIMLRMILTTLSVRMKAPEFAPESEWRLLTLATEGEGTEDPSGEKDAALMHFRPVGSRLVPYFNAAYGPGRTPIVSVRSGPTVDGGIAHDSIYRLLKKHGYPWRVIEVRSSEISLRE